MWRAVMTNGRSGREELVGYGSGEALLANGLHAIGKPQPDRKKRLLVDSFSRRQKSFIVYRRGKKKKKKRKNVPGLLCTYPIGREFRKRFSFLSFIFFLPTLLIGKTIRNALRIQNDKNKWNGK